jgi:hypothetical protein
MAVGNKFPEIFPELAGQPVTASALELIVSRQNTWFEYADPLRKSLESLRDKLLSLAQDSANPQADEALLAHHTFCHRLVFNSSARLMLSFPGLFGFNNSFELIQKRFAVNSDVFAQAAAEHAQIDRFRKLIRSTWQPRHDEIRKITPEEAFTGQTNTVQLELALVREIQSTALKQDDNPKE